MRIEKLVTKTLEFGREAAHGDAELEALMLNPPPELVERIKRAGVSMSASKRVIMQWLDRKRRELNAERFDELDWADQVKHDEDVADAAMDFAEAAQDLLGDLDAWLSGLAEDLRSSGWSNTADEAQEWVGRIRDCRGEE